MKKLNKWVIEEIILNGEYATAEVTDTTKNRSYFVTIEVIKESDELKVSENSLPLYIKEELKAMTIEAMTQQKIEEAQELADVTSEGFVLSSEVDGIEEMQNKHEGLKAEYKIINGLQFVNLQKFVMELVLKYEKKSIEKIARNTSRQVEKVVPFEDIIQDIQVESFAKYKMRFTNLNYFFTTIKYIAIHAVRKQARQYKKFKAVKAEFAPKIMADIDDLKEIKLDLKTIFTDEEYKIFRWFFTKDKTMKQIDQLLGKRCDRILKRVKQKAFEYFGQFENENRIAFGGLQMKTREFSFPTNEECEMLSSHVTTYNMYE
jgi:hypothetical protein